MVKTIGSNHAACMNANAILYLCFWVQHDVWVQHGIGPDRTVHDDHTRMNDCGGMHKCAGVNSAWDGFHEVVPRGTLLLNADKGELWVVDNNGIILNRRMREQYSTVPDRKCPSTKHKDVGWLLCPQRHSMLFRPMVLFTEPFGRDGVFWCHGVSRSIMRGRACFTNVADAAYPTNQAFQAKTKSTVWYGPYRRGPNTIRSVLG